MRTNRAAEIGAAVALAALVATVSSCFYGRYAFDDSYIGYALAQHLHDGNGFRYGYVNPGVLPTSAPLAVPLYAALAFLTGGSVVASAQLASVASLALFTAAFYLICRKLSTLPAALAATFAATGSPFVVLVWSHETLLYLASLALGVFLAASRKPLAGAFVVGCAALFRGEALFAIPFLAIWIGRRYGVRRAVEAFGASILPFGLWAAWAYPHFGTAFSQTIAAKQAQLRYAGVAPFDNGLHVFINTLYAAFGAAWFPLRFTQGVKLAWLVGLACGCLRLPHLLVLGWVALVFVSYVALQLPFYFWFAAPFAIALGLTVALLFPRDAVGVRLRPLLWIGRLAVAFVFVANAAVTTRLLADGQAKYALFDWVIMPRVSDNAYREVAAWFSTHSQTGDTIAFAEFGQLHYYAERDIVDSLGLVSAGAAAHLAAGDGIWTYERYRPQWIVETDDFAYFVEPAEYDWFARAYRRSATLVSRARPRDPHRSRFSIYRLVDAAAVPAPGELDGRPRVRTMENRGRSVNVAFAPVSDRMFSLEVRVRPLTSCRSVSASLVRDDGGIVAAAHEALAGGGPRRITLAFPAQLDSSRHAYGFRLLGCRVAWAPPPRLRVGRVLFGSPRPPPSTARDALRDFVERGPPGGRLAFRS